MKEPIWLSEAVVAAIHERQLAEHGGLSGVRDPGGFTSALNRPRNQFAYNQDMVDISALAAAYAYGLCTAHPFSDGNKRTSLVICRTFLRLNGYDLVASGADKYRMFYDLAAGIVSEDALGDWIRAHVVKTMT